MPTVLPGECRPGHPGSVLLPTLDPALAPHLGVCPREDGCRLQGLPLGHVYQHRLEFSQQDVGSRLGGKEQSWHSAPCNATHSRRWPRPTTHGSTIWPEVSTASPQHAHSEHLRRAHRSQAASGDPESPEPTGRARPPGRSGTCTRSWSSKRKRSRALASLRLCVFHSAFCSRRAASADSLL